MVQYQPPDRVLLMLGASFRSEPLCEAALRIADLLKEDISSLSRHGIPSDAEASLRKGVDQIRRGLTDKYLSKNDTPLQMRDVAETMADIRQWLVELRQLALLDLSLDKPALDSLSSAAPEQAEPYARDLLEELDLRIRAAAHAKPRLEDAGLGDVFLKRGRALHRKLKTAIGAEDLQGDNLPFQARRHYTRKSQLLRELQRISRAGRYVFRKDGRRAASYHLREIETPTALEK